MRQFAAIAAAAALVATASFAQASSFGRPCTKASQDTWLSLEVLQGKVEALGYTVRKGKLKKACGEFYAIDQGGNKVEVFVDPTDGTIVGTL